MTTADQTPKARGFGRSASSVSSEFIHHVRFLFESVVTQLLAKHLAISSGGRTLAIPAYVSAVAAVEACVNEMFLTEFLGMTFATPLLSDFRDSLENLDLNKELILIPQLAFGRTLEKGKEPYQDMAVLIRLRNELVHYRMSLTPPSFVRHLAQRGYAVRVPPEEEDGGPTAWIDRVTTIRGIQWAHNTACATVRGLIALAPPHKQLTASIHIDNFSEQHEEALGDRLKATDLKLE